MKALLKQPGLSDIELIGGLMFHSIITGIIFVISLNCYAGEPVSKSFWSDKAIGGVDVLSQHRAHQLGARRILQGKQDYLVRWNNADWYFASQQSANKFAEDPERYRPRYNGFCANALSTGEGLVATNGQVWEFFDDELHLFYAEKGRQRWLKGHWQTYQATADKAWQQQLNH